MGVAENFKSLCDNLTVNNKELIESRCRSIAKRLNVDFWSLDSETLHRYYVGSYGRDTAIRNFHDLDVLFELPYSEYERYNNYSSNGQSALLQAVKNSILKTYSQTEVGGDGQVVVVRFSDGMRFEIVPAFINNGGSYTYPDANSGGAWKITDPMPEIDAIAKADSTYNYNLKRLCRMVRAWRRQCNVQMGGLLIDTLAFGFIQGWEYRSNSFWFYDWMTRDFLLHLSNQSSSQQYWLAPGSGQYAWRKNGFEYKAKQSYNIALEAIKFDSDSMPYSAAAKWREIYGSFYP